MYTRSNSTISVCDRLILIYHAVKLQKFVSHDLHEAITKSETAAVVCRSALLHAAVLPGEGADTEGKTLPESTAAEQERSKDGGADLAARQDSDSNNKLAAKPGDDRACTLMNLLGQGCTQSAGSSYPENLNFFKPLLTLLLPTVTITSCSYGRRLGSGLAAVPSHPVQRH